MRDLNTHLAAVQAIAPQVITTSGGAVASTDLDLQGFNSAVVAVSAGTPGVTLSASVKFDIKIEHADDDGAGAAGAYAAVAAADVQGVTPDESGNVILIDADAEADAIYQFGYVGNKRFVKVTITPSAGHTTGTPFAVELVKGNAHIK